MQSNYVSAFRVIGTKRLRVVDASVMPTQISGTPNSAIVVIAEKAADLIKVREGGMERESKDKMREG